jgi:enamine deaminase RidA (YjgF/YER057c/UK114 family)
VIVAPDGRTVYIAGQVAFDSTGQVVGAGDFRVQLEQVYGNLRRALASVGGSMADLVKTTTYVADLSQIGALREIRARYLDADHPPANTLLPVASLARPELLVEIEAIAILPAPYRP